VSLVVSSPQGCTDSTTQAIVVNPAPVADFIMSPEVNRDEEIEFINQSIGATEYFWNFNDFNIAGGGFSILETPTFSYAEQGFYTIQLLATNEFGCKDSTEKTISVKGVGVRPPQLPTGFTPNGDGVNDTLYVRGGPFVLGKFTFNVFNEWGQKIFTSSDPLIGWAGDHKDLPVPVGIYIWTVNATTVEGSNAEETNYKLSGNVSLMK
jgi:gliding motility-associated-like protein